MFIQKNILLFLSLLLSISLFSQSNRNIMNAEYFWDNDAPTTLLPVDGNFNSAIEDIISNDPVQFLSSGVHIFNIRVQDEDGTWSPVFERIINFSDPSQLRDLKVANAEYFWDNDAPTTLLSFDGNFNSAIEDVISNAYLQFPTGGAHIFNIRVEDEDGVWSPLFKRVIFIHGINNPNLDDCESDIDMDLICDNDDPDIDGDGIDNEDDPCQYNSDANCECNSDIDLDLICDNYDTDIDGDGIFNEDDPCQYNADPNCECISDIDDDGICDSEDTDMNGNGIPDDEEVLGCTDETACNYCEECLSDDTLCIYPNECSDCEDIGFVQSIELSSGWSLFSTYICPFNLELDSIMSEFINNNNLIIIKDENGDVFWPNYQINQIGTITNGKGYLIKIQNEATLNIYGDILNYNYPINLNNGWSYLGYLHQEPYLVTDMLSPIDENNLIIIKDHEGNIYWDEYAINTIVSMAPGKGYNIKLEEEMIFSYPDGIMGRYANHHDMIMYSSKFQDSKNTGNNMVIGIPEKAWNDKPSINDEIIIYDQNMLIVGKSKYRDNFTAITIWGNDELTEEKDGLFVGEEFLIKLFRSNENIIKNIKIKRWEEGSSSYSVDGISVVGLISEEMDAAQQLVKITDILGREISHHSKNTTAIYIYSDGTIKKRHLLK